MTAEPDLSIARAWHAADEEWKATAFRCIRWLAKTNPELTADDLWDAMERWYRDVVTSEPRALGHVFRQSAREGLIVKTGKYVESRRPSRHKSPIPVWRSTIYPFDTA
jgi:hypothetical protein